MNRLEWQWQVKQLEDRGKEIEKDYKAQEEALTATYSEHKARLEKEMGEAKGDLVMGVDGADDRLEFAQRTLTAVEKGYADKLDQLERAREGDLLGLKKELEDLYKQQPTVDKAIDNAEPLIELGKEGVKSVTEVTLPPVDMGGPQQWEAAQESAKLILATIDALGVAGTAQLAANQLLGQILGDSKDKDQPADKLEHWIGEAQKHFDDKYKDSPAEQRESMQEKLDQKFDLLRDALERKQEKEIEPNEPLVGGW